MGSFWAELRRRNVFRVAAAYTVAAWVLIQVADTVFPALQLPMWTVTFVAMVLILGLPAALLLSLAWWSIEGLLPDPRLDPVRDDPRFRALVEKYRRP